jgi:ribosome maturation factor RimP
VPTIQIETTMTDTTVVTHIESVINDWLTDKPGYFLVQVRVKPTNNVKVFLDGDDGITIDVCTKLSRLLYTNLEDSGLFAGADFSLEVSSAGVGEPLLLLRQYHKNVGRRLEVKLTDGIQLEGTLQSASENGFVLETTTGKGKKMTTQLHQIPFSTLKSAEVQVKF